MIAVLENLLIDALGQLQKRGVISSDDSSAVVVSPASHPHFGDFSSNIALMLARSAGLSATEIAKALIAELPACPAVGRIAVGGPGFINFYYSPAGQAGIIESVLQQAAQYGRSDSGQLRSVQLESIIASATQGFTLSDARSAALAATMADMLKAIGFSICGRYSDTLSRNPNTGVGKSDSKGNDYPSPVTTLARDKVNDIDRLVCIFPAGLHDKAIGLLSDFMVPGEKLQLVPVAPVFVSHGAERLRAPVQQGARALASNLIDEIGEDSARFLFLMRNPCRTLHIDLQRAGSQSNTSPVYVVQFAHALACSVLRQQQQRHLAFDLDFGTAAAHRLQEGIERDILALLAVYPQLLKSAAQTCQPWRLVDYLTDLAKHLQNYYKTHKVLARDVELRHARVSLLLAIRQVLSNALELIGVSVPEVM